MAEERIPFRGGLTCSCVVKSLPFVEKDLQQRGLINGSIRIFQLGYRTDVDASAGTHARGGCTDVAPFNAAVIDVWRQWGWTMQDRSPFFADDHAHGWPYKCPHLSAAAQQQEDDWDRKDAGLVGGAHVQGRWPVLPWNEAFDKMVPTLISQLGVPLMAGTAVPIRITYHDDQALTPVLVGRVNVKQGGSTVVFDSSEGIDCTATIVVNGLKPGETVDLWWGVEWKKDGSKDQDKTGTPVPVTLHEDGGIQVRYAEPLEKAGAGGTACLRLFYKTDSATAMIVQRKFRGWKLV